MDDKDRSHNSYMLAENACKLRLRGNGQTDNNSKNDGWKDDAHGAPFLTNPQIGRLPLRLRRPLLRCSSDGKRMRTVLETATGIPELDREIVEAILGSHLDYGSIE